MSEQPKPQDVVIGGNLQKGITGQYSLSVGEVLKESLRMTSNRFLRLFPAMMIFMAIHLTILWIAMLQMTDMETIQAGLDSLKLVMTATANTGMSLEDSLTPEQITQIKSVVNELLHALGVSVFIAYVLTGPLYAGYCMQSMNISVGLETRIGDIFKGFRFTVPFVLLMLVIGGIELVIPSLLMVYLTLATMFTPYLMIEKRLPLFRAIGYSFVAFHKRLLPLLLIGMTIFIAGFILSLLTQGLAFFFFFPLWFMAKAICYRNAFGLTLRIEPKEGQASPAATDDDQTPPSQGSSGHFDA
ncbi:hypothetical protein VST7929_01369 [Vibrio stylophorae]|uniref:Transmembrane protein n=1 Tax=Vibrio stylophorae TaxID=659351 RepID=A0ABN8DQQ0_9VIBR|nr:hypothetical protein [Vibrio stylophorae]CAH0533499.1 hypothetical protein VST7929_01369 [Vibrio stylophorae]